MNNENKNYIVWFDDYYIALHIDTSVLLVKEGSGDGFDWPMVDWFFGGSGGQGQPIMFGARPGV